MIPLDTDHRLPLCRVLICAGSTCGRNPDLDARSLESVWEAEGLHAAVAMKICSCQDLCEHASIARIVTPHGTEWFERLRAEHYRALLEWARDCHKANAILARPAMLETRRFKGRIDVPAL